MNHDQFNFITSVAQELQRLEAIGAPVDRKVLDWAGEVMRKPPKIAPFRPSKHHGPIKDALSNAPICGLQATELSKIAGIIPRALSVALSQMAYSGKVAMIKIPGRSRYFIDREAMEAGREAVAAQEALLPPSRRDRERANRKAISAERRAEKVAGKARLAAIKALKIPRLPKPKMMKAPKPKPIPKAPKPITLLVGKKRSQAIGPARMEGEPIITENTKITRAEPPPERMYRTTTFAA